MAATRMNRAGKHAEPRARRNSYDSFLERLPERLEHRGWKLSELVEEKDTAMSETDLPRSYQWRPASDDRDGRCTVMGGAERWPLDESTRGNRKPADGVDASDL